VQGFCESGGGEKASYPPGLLLILCRFCLELDKTIIGYMVRDYFVGVLSLLCSFQYNTKDCFV
jgi:hypothetical protein